MTTSPRAGPSAQATKTASANGAPENTQDAYTSLQPGALATANKLARLMIEEPHRFALHGDQQLISSGLDALKALFDFSVETEGPAIPAIAEALRSVFPDDDKVSTRSGGAKRKRRGGRAASPPKSHRLFEPTPLSELVTDGMVDSQVWDQLELRNNKICTLLDAVIVTEDGGEEDDADDESDDVSEDEALDEVEKKRRTVAQDSDDEEEDEDEEGPLEDEIMRNISQLTDADLRALGIDPAQRETLEALSAQAGEDEDEDESEDDDDGGEGYPGASDLSEDDELSGVIVTEPLLTEAEQQKRKAAAEAEERRQLRSQRQMMKMMQRMQEGAEDDDAEESDDDEEVEEDDDDEEDESYEDEEEDEDTDEEQEGEDESSVKSLLDNLDAPGSNNASPSRANNGRRGAAVDDAFFSIDQFNRDTDDYGDDGVDLGDDVDLFTSLDDQEEQEQETPLYYADFFAAPPNKDQVKRKPEKAGRVGARAQTKEAATSAKKTAVRFNDSVSVLRIKARKKKEATITSSFLEALQQQLPSGEAELQNDSPASDEDDHSNDAAEDEDEDEDEEDSDDDAEDDASDSAAEDMSEDPEDMVSSPAMDVDEESENEASDIEAEKETFGRVAGDLFADEESEDEQQRSSQSRHQQRLNVLQEEIAKLERENVGKKEWNLMGEAGSRARPENSLLEQDVDFESNRKAKPVNTPETTQSIEDLIKKRILENQFDDVQRRATLQPLDFIPSKMLELSDVKNPKSLGQVYEEELGGVADTQGARLDKELQKEHEEIDVLYSKLEEQLDALSNAHYTPKAPKVAIRTISDTAAIALEESLPTMMNNGTQLAPEEVYDAGAHNTTLQGVSSEMTPEEKQKRHRQLRDEKRTRNDRIAEHKRNVEIHREAFGQSRGGRFVGNASGSGKAGGQHASEEKEEALRKLMGNKGVSVVGKGSGSQANGAKKGTNGTGNASQYKL